MEKKFRVKKMTDGDGYAVIWQVSGDIRPQDINEAVYAAMCEAGKDILSQSVCRLSGEHTAVELAGKLGGIPAFDIPDGMAPRVRINVGLITVGYKQQAPMFTCSFAPDDVFGTIAEWEGATNMAPKKYHRFSCKAKEELKLEAKPYVRHRGYRPTRISYAADERRVSEKFETLGRMYECLSSLGMRRALSVIAAARLFENMDYVWQRMAKEAMQWKLWRDYATKKPDSRPVPFIASDFNCGPECYKQVDDVYVRELVNHFRLMMQEAPKPRWPERGDLVTIKEDARTLKKHEGRHLVDSVSARLSADGRRIEWTVAVSVGKYECEHFLPEQLEPATKDGPKKKSSKPKAKTGAKPKPVPKAQTADINQPEPSLSERLRQALLARLAA